MGKMKNDMQENNPLLQVYMKILPVTILAIAAIFVLVKVISGILAPDQLVLNVTYRDYEEGAMLQNPIRIAKDPAFEEEVKLQSDKKKSFLDILVLFEATAEKPAELAELDAQLMPEEVEEPENGTYTFTYEKVKLPKTVYWKAPVWWHPVKTEGTLTAPLKIGEKIELTEDLGPIASGSASFEITGIETTKISTGIFNITVNMTSSDHAAPSNVKLVMGEEVFNEWDGSTELSYDAENGFADRTLVFRYNRSLKDDISDLLEDAVIVVEEITAHREFNDAELTSNIDGVELICVE